MLDRLLFILIALVVAGECLILLALGDEINPAWASARNLLFLGLDLLTGAVLVLFALRFGPRMSALIVAALLGLALITHTVREIEYWLEIEGVFSFHPALAMINAVKLFLISLAILRGDRET